MPAGTAIISILELTSNQTDLTMSLPDMRTLLPSFFSTRSFDGSYLVCFTIALGTLSFITVTYAAWIIYFHPLSKFPGPKRAILSNVGYKPSRAVKRLNYPDLLL